MKYAEINKRYTEIAAEYMAKGYTVNTTTMGGSQGEIAHLDLTDGREIIRILVDSFHEWTDTSLDGVEIRVGRAAAEIKPNYSECHQTIWNNRLEPISVERFYEVGADRRRGKFYGTPEEATKANELRFRRWKAKHSHESTWSPTEPMMEAAKRIVRSRLGLKRISQGDVRICKGEKGYVVYYRNKVCRPR